MSRTLPLLALLALLTVACLSAEINTQVFDRSAESEALIPATGSEAFSGCGGTYITAVNPDFEQAVVEQTNEIRMLEGLGPLKRVKQLDESARYHTADMSVNDYFNHDTFNRDDGNLSMVCDTWHRIEFYYKDWQALAENIAAGQRTPEGAMNGWMNSPDHKHNILSDSYWEIGVGFFEGGGEYRFYWDQNFGRRDGIYPLIINGEKAKTASPNVSVYIYGDWEEMRLRNDNGAWGEWVPFQTSFNWLLPDDLGIHTVTAELRSNRKSATTSDTIRLEP
jgi:uncharacterized protein YkwD